MSSNTTTAPAPLTVSVEEAGRLHQLLGLTHDNGGTVAVDGEAVVDGQRRELDLLPGVGDRPPAPGPRPQTDHPRVRHRLLQAGRDPARRTAPAPDAEYVITTLTRTVHQGRTPPPPILRGIFR
jgi:hypothetical protein